MDYSSLVTTVASRLNRDDLTTLVPDFIAEAESVINDRLGSDPVRPMGSTFDFTTSVAEVALPDDFLDVIKLEVTDSDDNSWTLVRLHPSDEQGYYASRAQPYRQEYNSERIQHYTILGTTLTLGDTPESSLTGSLKYWARVPALTSSADSNWLIERHPNVYLYGVLAAAHRHERDRDSAAERTDDMMASIELMRAAYPNNLGDTELRAIDAPWTGTVWNINNG